MLHIQDDSLNKTFRKDKLADRVSPDLEIKLQQFGQRLGNNVLIYNRRRQQEQNGVAIRNTVIGTILGASLGGLTLKPEWVPQVIRTKLGDRIPAVLRSSSSRAILSGAVAGGTTLFLTSQTYYFINRLANPNKVFNADPLLDGGI